jgi:uncharacterized protein (TIGR02145 family)
MEQSKIAKLVLLFLLIIIFGCEKNENENQSLTCIITNPDSGEEIVQGQAVTISVDADHTDGNIIEVGFYVDGSGVGSSGSFPYNYEWNTTGAEIGSHTIKATAKDNEGSSATDEINIEIVEADNNIVFNPDLTYGTISDIDGNTYKTIQIGEQEWMAQNLAATKYNDGTAIPLETSSSGWSNLTTPAYCWYNNDEATYKADYGALYNWYVVETGKLCPTGWHVPTDAEWKELELYLGMSQSELDAGGSRGTDEGGKLKETGTTHWNYPNTATTNESGFTAVPGGCRYGSDGSFDLIGLNGAWWSASKYFSSRAWYRLMSNDYGLITRSTYTKNYGFSIRCLRD